MHLANVFSDANRGGAAITIATGLAAQEVGELVSGTAIVSETTSVSETHPFTLKRFPGLELMPTGLVPLRGPIRGARALAHSLLILARPRAKGIPDGLALVREADLVISKGGYVFVDRPFIRDLLSFWQTTFPLTYASRLGIPTATSPTTIGPLPTRLSRSIVRFVLSHVDLLVVRDPISAQEAAGLGLPLERIVELPDIAFSMPPPSPADTASAQAELSLTGTKYACFILRHDAGTPDADMILDAQVAAARQLVEEHIVDEIVLARQVPNTGSPPEEAFRSRLPFDVLDTGDHWSPSQLMALYAGASVVVTSRLHAAIFSLSCGVPAIAVSVDGVKTEGVYESIGAPADWVVPVHAVSRDRLTRSAVDAANNSRDTRVALLARAAEARACLATYPILLRALLSEKKAHLPPPTP